MHYIDLLSIQTPRHLRQGLEHRTRFDCGAFEINIFETFRSSTKVQIQYDGLSISGMIRGHKVVHTHPGETFLFEPGTSLILPEGKTVYADFPEADAQRPVQCATILIASEKLAQQLRTLDLLYPLEQGHWQIDFEQLHFNNDSGLVRAFNELLQLTQAVQQQETLNDLLLKSFLVRIIQAQKADRTERMFLQTNNQLFNVKKYIKENLSEPITMEQLTAIGNCSQRTLFRFFETYCQRTPGAYIAHERMALARNLLLQPNNNITEVAYRCGFSSVSYFTKQFKQYNQCTPKEFMNRFSV